MTAISQDRTNDGDLRDRRREQILNFFGAFERRVRLLDRLDNEGFQDEALLLCCCYIEGLGNAFWPQEEKREYHFVEVLRRYGGDEYWSAIVPQHLMDRLREKGKNLLADKIAACLKAEIDGQELLCEARLLSHTESSLIPGELNQLRRHLWRGTIADLAYKELRSYEVHRLGLVHAINFDGFLYKGLPVQTLDFDVLYSALLHIVRMAKEYSLSASALFGHHFEAGKLKHMQKSAEGA